MIEHDDYHELLRAVLMGVSQGRQCYRDLTKCNYWWICQTVKTIRQSVLCWLHESFTGHAPPNRISPCSQLRIELVAYGLRICRLVGLR